MVFFSLSTQRALHFLNFIFKYVLLASLSQRTFHFIYTHFYLHKCKLRFAIFIFAQQFRVQSVHINFVHLMIWNVHYGAPRIWPEKEELRIEQKVLIPFRYYVYQKLKWT